MQHNFLDFNTVSGESIDVIYLDYTYWNQLLPNCHEASSGYTVASATAMYLAYFDDCFNSNIIINSSHKGTNGVGSSSSLYSYMINQIGSDDMVNSPTPSDGFNTYFSDNLVPICLNFHWTEISTEAGIRSAIDDGIPVIVYLYNQVGTAYEACICFGYLQLSEYYYVYAINPCFGRFVSYNGESLYYPIVAFSYATITMNPYSYFNNVYKAYYLDNINSYHQYHSYTYYQNSASPSIGHIAECTRCGHSHLEGHQYMLVGLSRYRCISCGYITNNTGQEPIISGIGGDSE